MLRSLSALFLLLAAAPCLAADARPNILFCLADDWGWPHADLYGDQVVATPTFDRLAHEGVLFTRAFVAAPTCTASRAAILTGQTPHRLGESANLWSRLQGSYEVYPDLLEQAGYAVGLMDKGWGPGSLEGTGRTRNPAGPKFASLEDFLSKSPKDKPFCFWFGSHDPHRDYDKGSGLAAGKDPSKVQLAPWLVDTPAARSDMLDYYLEVERFDRQVGEMLDLLKREGRLENTIVVMGGDNGYPFPRGKGGLYDAGAHVPLAIAWPGHIPGGRIVDDFVNFADLAPTFLEFAGLNPPAAMTGRSLVNVLLSQKSGQVDPKRDCVFTERERHAYDANDGKSYPMRAIRTRDYLLVLNIRPQLWPAGDPRAMRPLRDCDAGPTRDEMIAHATDPKFAAAYALAFAKRPRVELFDLRKDPNQMVNVADKPDYAETRATLIERLEQWMRDTADPRAGHPSGTKETEYWDSRCPYYHDKYDPSELKDWNVPRET